MCHVQIILQLYMIIHCYRNWCRAFWTGFTKFHHLQWCITVPSVASFQSHFVLGSFVGRQISKWHKTEWNWCEIGVLPVGVMHIGCYVEPVHCSIGWLVHTLGCVHSMELEVDGLELVLVVECMWHVLVAVLVLELAHGWHSMFRYQCYIAGMKRNKYKMKNLSKRKKNLIYSNFQIKLKSESKILKYLKKRETEKKCF